MSVICEMIEQRGCVNPFRLSRFLGTRQLLQQAVKEVAGRIFQLRIFGLSSDARLKQQFV
jgi:hypothetical protein